MPLVGEKDRKTEEYEKDPELLKEDLIHLREWLNTQKHLPDITEEMLKRFHHSCYYNLNYTKDCIEIYFTLRSNTPELFTARDVTEPELAKSLDAMRIAIMPVTDSRGYRIICRSLADSDPNKFVHKDNEKLMIMTMDACMARYGCDTGIIFVSCMKGASLRHLAKCTLSIIRKTVLYHQEANPIRMKESHVINVVPWIDKMMSLLKPFMKKELIDLMHFHSDMKSLYERIPREYLPEEFGGTQQSMTVLHEENVKQLASMREFFLEEEKMRIDESKRESKKKKKKSIEPVNSLKNLEID